MSTARTDADRQRLRGLINQAKQKLEATNQTTIVPCSADSYVTPGFEGAATVVLTGPGVFEMTLRGLNDCAENKGQPFEVHWHGTVQGSTMVLKFKPTSKGWALTRQ